MVCVPDCLWDSHAIRQGCCLGTFCILPRFCLHPLLRSGCPASPLHTPLQDPDATEVLNGPGYLVMPGKTKTPCQLQQVSGHTMHQLMVYPGPKVGFKDRDQPHLYRYAVDFSTREGVAELVRRARGEEPELDMVPADMTLALLHKRWDQPPAEQERLAAAAIEAAEKAKAKAKATT